MVPEYVKLDPETYRLAVEPDGLPVPSLSPHCRATLEADKRAFVELMKCVREEDQDYGTVLAVQVENEAGLAGTDRDYSKEAQADFEKGVPQELAGVEIPDSGALWKGQQLAGTLRTPRQRGLYRLVSGPGTSVRLPRRAKRYTTCPCTSTSCWAILTVRRAWR